jgi:hypothetical protein
MCGEKCLLREKQTRYGDPFYDHALSPTPHNGAACSRNRFRLRPISWLRTHPAAPTVDGKTQLEVEYSEARIKAVQEGWAFGIPKDVERLQVGTFKPLLHVEAALEHAKATCQ